MSPRRPLALLACGAACALLGPEAASRGALPEAHAASSAPKAATTREAIDAHDARRAYVVAAIGDSLTDPRAHGGLYLRALARRCPASRFDGYGVGGQTTFDMRGRFVDDVFGEGKPAYTHVIVLGGVNDLVMGFVDGARLARIEEQLGIMYRVARERGVDVVAVTVPPHPMAGASDRSDALNAWIRERADTRDVAFVVDLASRLACGTPDLLCPEFRATPGERIHWGQAGHVAVADEMLKVAFGDCR